MRKLSVLTLLFIISVLTARAQIKKGSTLLGGELFYFNSNINYHTSQPNQLNRTASFNIAGGKAIRENNFVGLNLSYSANKSRYNAYNNNFDSKINQYSVGAFYRKYKKLAKDLYFFGEMGAGYNSNDQKDTDSTGADYAKYTRTGGELYLTPGISYQVFKKFYVEILIPRIVSAQYEVSKTKSQTQNSKEDQFSFITNLNANSLDFLGVGFRIIF